MRGNGNVLCVCAAVCESEDFVALLEVLPSAAFCAQLGDCAGEFDTEDLGGARRDGVSALALQKIHAVQAECLDLDERLRLAEGWLGDLCNVECIDRALAILDVCRV